MTGDVTGSAPMAMKKIVRRSFLTSGAAVGAAVVSSAADPGLARTYSGQVPWAPHQADQPEPLQSPDFVFFTSAERRFVEAATERLIPHDDLGPGAREAGVPIFIDHQLAGPFGRGARWYMQGPWAKGEPTQGYQSRMAPADMYRAAIKAIDAHVAAQSGSASAKAFADLAPDDQDKLLGRMEEGKLELSGVDAKSFFKLLWQNTKEGMFSDPIYGGNKDMMGWAMLGFPGARYDYRDWVGKHGQRYTEPPVGIMGRKAWTPARS
jgi:gluconate 2-dehydrogenase gamma chain